MMRRVIAFLVAFVASCAPVPTGEPAARAAALFPATSLPPMRAFPVTRAAPPSRPNTQIAQDFLDLAFRMESGRNVPRLTRFIEPISVRVTGQVPPSLGPDLDQLLARLRAEARIDIFRTDTADAKITIQALPRATLANAVPNAACFVVPRVSSWTDFLTARRTARVDWTTLNMRDRVAIFVPADVAPQEIRDCLQEELAQALGPLNDLYRLPDSVFNDDNIHAVLTGFDMLILRLYYHPRLQNGMSRAEVAAVLPGLLDELNPGGASGPGGPINDTSRDWIQAMEAALTNSNSSTLRRSSAARAVGLARAFGWTGPRRGFAYYAFGRLQISRSPEQALAAFTQADAAYRSSPLTALHAAHVAVQLAAFALNAADGAATVALADEAIPVAYQNQNAALLATLLMFRAEGLELLGRGEEAQAARMDSLGWARYGFGSEANVRARLNEVQRLNPYNGVRFNR